MPQNKIVILYLSMAIILLISSNWISCVEGQEAKQFTCTGKVVDENGQPVAGARVSLYERIEGQMERFYDTRLEGNALTKADGKFTFSTTDKSDRYFYLYCVVEKEGFALGWANWDFRDDVAKELEIRLGQKAELAGIIVDENDKPIPQAQVGIYRLVIGEEENQQHLLNDIVPKLLTTQTNQEGRFTFTDLPTQAKAEFLVRKTGFATVCTYTSSREVKYTPGQSDIKLVLSKEAIIKGVVVEKDSAKPVSGIKLEVKREGNRSITGQKPVSTAEDGTFSFHALAAGKYVLRLARRQDGLAEWAVEQVKVELESEQVQTDLRIELCKGGLLRIRVMDTQSKKPLEKAHVSIRDEMRQQWIYGRSNKKGIAQVRLMPGAYKFNSISLQGYSSKYPRKAFTIEDGKTQRFRQQLTRQPKYAGIVRDEKGKPVKGAKLRICPISLEEVISDTEGRFEISWDPGMGVDERQVPHLVCRHIEDNLAAVVILFEGKRTHDITLKPGVTAIGKVVDPDGRGIANARIRTMLRQTGWASTMSRDAIRTDAAGNFEITTLPVEHGYNLNISAKGYGDGHVDFHADDAVNSRIEIEDVILPLANLAVSGLLVDMQGNPIPNVRIESYNFNSGQPERLTTRTDPQGRFTFDGVCEGKFNIRVNISHDGKRLSARAITNGGASGIKVIAREGRSIVQNLRTKTYDQILQESEKVIASVVLDEKGLPVSGVPVGVCCHKRMRKNGKFSWTFSDFSDLSATTDKQGRFAIELKEDGEYNLRFSPDHYAAVIIYDIPVGKKDLKVTLAKGGTVTGRLVRMDKGKKAPIPNVEVKIEQPDRASYTHLGFDRDQTTVTDEEGRFEFEHLRTKIRPHGSMSRKQWDHIARVWEISYGDTSKTIAFYEGTRIDDIELLVESTKDQLLVGRALPGFKGIEIDLGADQAKNKMMLICFFDMNQRPSRHYITQLTGRTAKLNEKGVEIVAIQATKIEMNGLLEWIKQSNILFPVGTVLGNDENIRFTWNIKSLPWLILADKEHIVRAEGLRLDELDIEIKKASK